MLYFQPYLKEGQDFEDIDISVHCDVKIFDWLLRYVEFKEWTLKKMKFCNPKSYTDQLNSIVRTGFFAKHVKYKKGERRTQIEQEKLQMANIANEPLQPILDLKNALSVLISSDFLQMHDLVKECISYVVLNLNDVVRLPIDMNCIN